MLTPAPVDGDDAAMSDDAPTTGRRGFLAQGALMALLAAAAGTVYAALRLALPRPGQRRWIPVGRFGDFVPGTWRMLPGEPIYLVASTRGLAAVSARCTHLGCTVRRRGEGFICPCHGSRFDDLGRALNPPAQRPLPWLRVEVVGQRVFVDPSREVASDTYMAVGGAGV